MNTKINSILKIAVITTKNNIKVTMSTSCTHTKYIEFAKIVNCCVCGTLKSSSSNTYKDDSYNTPADVSPALLYTNMLKNQALTRYYNPEAEYIPVTDLLTSLASKIARTTPV